MIVFWLLPPIIIALLLGLKFLFFSKAINRNGLIASRFLGVFFLLFWVVMTASLVVGTIKGESVWSALVNLLSLQFYVALIALPPTVYLYLTHLTNQGSKTNETTTILPHYYLSLGLFMINTIAFIYFQTTPEEVADDYTYKLIENVMTYSNFVALIFIFPIVNVYYCYKSYVVYNRHKKLVGSFFSYEEGVSLNWVKSFLTGYVLFLILIYTLQLGPSGNLLIPTSILACIYLGYIGYRGHKQLPVLLDKNEIADNVITPNVSQKPSNSKKVSLLEEQKHLELKDRLLTYMINEKPYINSKLSIYDLSKSLNSNTKYLSNLINIGFQQNFVTFINSYRIEEAKKLLVQPDNQRFTIEAIANMSGFHAKSTFNTVFKQLTGQTPSSYKRTHSSNNTSLREVNDPQ